VVQLQPRDPSPALVSALAGSTFIPMAAATWSAVSREHGSSDAFGKEPPVWLAEADGELDEASAFPPPQPPAAIAIAAHRVTDAAMVVARMTPSRV
jgi:hypothetical protein